MNDASCNVGSVALFMSVFLRLHQTPTGYDSY